MNILIYAAFQCIRLAATAVHALCKELVKSAESASTAHNGSVDCRFSSVADILSCVDFLVKDIGNFLMNGLFLFFLKLLLEQITELIFKFVALDMDGDEYFYLEHVSDIGNATAFKNSKKKVCTPESI